MSDTRQKKYGEAPAPRSQRPAGRATERRSFHEESRNDRERGRRSEAPRRQYSSFTGEQAERPSRRQEEFSGWSRPGQREARAPRDARPSPWQMESELLPALPDVVRRELDALGQALRTVRPLRSAHYRNLPADIEALSRLLTCERSGLYRPYWSSPASTSAYLYYFLPWNVLRLARLFRSLPLPDPRLWLEKGQTPLLLDGGSGPLSVPLALWLARPEWRALPIQVLAVDNAVQPMELGRGVMAAWGDILGQPVWQVRVERGSLEHMPRLECKLADTLERQERHLRPWLLTAANVLNELSAESRQMNREDDEDEEGSGGVRRLENLLDELEPLCWPAPLNEDETGSADEALLPAALFVEPGTRLGGKTISRLRDAALERDLMPLAPCTHRAPCPLAHAPFDQVRRCALRVLVYHDRMAVEFFHAVTDGTGGLIFLKTLTAEYLCQKYGISIPAEKGVLGRLEEPSPQELEDSFLRYAGDVTASRAESTAYHLSGTPEKDGYKNLITMMVPVDRVRACARQHGVSVTELLGAAMMQAIADQKGA